MRDVSIGKRGSIAAVISREKGPDISITIKESISIRMNLIGTSMFVIT